MREASTPTPSLPDDPVALRALLLAAWAERNSLSAERDALAELIERLQHLLQKLQRMQFGPRSERLPEDQLRFAFEEAEASIAATEAEAEKGSPDLYKKNTAPIAAEALRRIAALYAVEDTVRGQPPDQRRAARQARSQPLAADLFGWLEQQLTRAVLSWGVPG